MYLRDDIRAQLVKAEAWFEPMSLSLPDDTPGWITAADLLNSHLPYLPDSLKKTAAHYKATDLRSPAALWFGNYASAVMVIPIAAYLTGQCVPEMDAAKIQLRLDNDGRIDAIAWGDLPLATLTTGSEIANESAMQVETIAALRDYLSQQFVDHFMPLVEAVRAQSGLGRPALWALAADYCSNNFSWIGEILGNQPEALEEARIIASGITKLKRKKGFIPVTHCEKTYQLLDRVSCCLYYQVQEGEYCTSCPHRPVEQRIERIKEWMETSTQAA